MFDNLSEKFSDAFKNISGKGKISESNIEETLKQVRTALLEADVNFKVVKEFVGKVKEQALGEKVLKGVNPGEQFVKIMHDELTSLMGDEHQELKLERPLNPILIVGLNGAGKTTFSGKLALFLKNKQKKEVFLIPADNFRPAAKDQLIKHAKNMQIDYFDSDLSMLPKDIVKAGMEEAKKLGKSVVIVDTAGRLQVDEELMGQLVDVKNELKDPEVLLVADAMTGQEAVNVAKVFHEKVGLTGAVLSKMDSDARGGAALSIKYVTNVPIRFISVGEKMKELEPFHPDRLAKRILDMGDVVSLVEKAQETIDEKEAERMMKRLEKQQFTITDFIKQMDQINKLGSMGSIMKMIPGMGGMMRQIGDLSPAENEMKKMRVMIDSMTQKERDNHKLLNESRIQRIAKGSGTTDKEVKDFIKKFEQMQSMMINMMGMMKGGAMPNIPGMPAMPGFRQAAGSGKKKKSGKKKGPFGSKFF
ncbi:MAG: signal recognition particle protein [Bacteriovoracaceae bacterium]|jgi:signal recognition particle subunit SRP54|nr:signal recognition particle protein [Bacteriovoracaceae bacterium]|tara:strand:- start:203 stop:1627 length:1425 start_codon:yes stop_codon:yes gene_type:complete